MDTFLPNAPRWISAIGFPPPGYACTTEPQLSDTLAKAFQPSAGETARFLRIVSQCTRISRHYDIYRWLSGEVQHFLPHEILLSAWGDFATCQLTFDLTSGMPGVRTGQLAHCRVDHLVRRAYARWIAHSRKPVLVPALETEGPLRSCQCPIHTALRGMRAVVVHGVYDKRSGHDSLFIALTAGSFTKGRSVPRFITVLDPLVVQIDAAFRKVPAFARENAQSPLRERATLLDLSAREREVLASVCRGQTNLEIATGLDISPFTVKNHVQRIFRKIGVTNRTQAAARYSEALREAAEAPPRQPPELLRAQPSALQARR